MPDWIYRSQPADARQSTTRAYHTCLYWGVFFFYKCSKVTITIQWNMVFFFLFYNWQFMLLLLLLSRKNYLHFPIDLCWCLRGFLLMEIYWRSDIWGNSKVFIWELHHHIFICLICQSSSYLVARGFLMGLLQTFQQTAVHAPHSKKISFNTFELVTVYLGYMIALTE